MLIIRVGMASELSQPAQSQGTWAAAVSERSGLRRRLDGTFEMKDLEVKITQVVEDDSAYERGAAASDKTLSGISFARPEAHAGYKGAPPLGMSSVDLEAESPSESGSTNRSARVFDHEIV